MAPRAKLAHSTFPAGHWSWDHTATMLASIKSFLRCQLSSKASGVSLPGPPLRCPFSVWFLPPAVAEALPDCLWALSLCFVLTRAPFIQRSHRPAAGLRICSPSTVPPRAQHTVGPQQKSAERTNQPGFCQDIQQNTGGYLGLLLSTTQLFFKYFCFIYQKSRQCQAQ